MSTDSLEAAAFTSVGWAAAVGAVVRRPVSPAAAQLWNSVLFTP